MIQLLMNKTTPPFQLLPMPRVDKSLLRIHEAPPLQLVKSQVIQIYCLKDNGEHHTFSDMTTIYIV